MPSELHDHSKGKHLYTVSDLLEWKPPPVYRLIYDGILNAQNRMFIFGDEGSWKSMLALHTSHCLSRGSNWLGFRTNPCNVYKLQVELPMYMERLRVEKYCLGSEKIFRARHTPENSTTEAFDAYDKAALTYAYPTNAVNRTEQFINIDESFGFQSLKEDIETCITEFPERPLIVILDPLYKMFNRDLSSESDVKPLLDKLDILMSQLDFSIIIVHHSRKAITDESGLTVGKGSQDSFGARAWSWWADTILRIDLAEADSTSTRVNLNFTKHRNADRLLPSLSIRWDKDTLHPRILNRHIPTDPAQDEEIEVRGDLDYAQLE